jgi:hypothetical protein
MFGSEKVPKTKMIGCPFMTRVCGMNGRPQASTQKQKGPAFIAGPLAHKVITCSKADPSAALASASASSAEAPNLPAARPESSEPYSPFLSPHPVD